MTSRRRIMANTSRSIQVRTIVRCSKLRKRSTKIVTVINNMNNSSILELTQMKAYNHSSLQAYREISASKIRCHSTSHKCCSLLNLTTRKCSKLNSQLYITNSLRKCP
jgi:hypothetical protein